MSPDDLRAAARSGPPPADLSDPLRVLWLDAAGDWEGAHDVAQDMPGPAGAQLHAYLHRVEGDLGNAGYWYHRAGVSVRSDALEAEWHDLVVQFSS